MKELAIVVSPNGAVKSLCDDGFSLGFLGPQCISRVTEIWFDNRHQYWVVSSPDKQFIMFRGFLTQERARDAEVKFVNHCFANGLDPCTREGLESYIHSVPM